MSSADVKTMVGVVMGLNRMRGQSVGAMFANDHEFGLGDGMQAMTTVLRSEAELLNIEVSQDWLNRSLGQVLRMYEQGYEGYMSERQGCVGFVYEFALPSGRSVLLGDPRTLKRSFTRH